MQFMRHEAFKVTRNDNISGEQMHEFRMRLSLLPSSGNDFLMMMTAENHHHQGGRPSP
jgi:hypothetical protein